MNRDLPSPSLVDSDDRFRRYYARHLEPLEQHFEALRRRTVKERNRRFAAASAVWLAAVGGTAYRAHPIGEVWPFVVFFGLATGIGLGMWAWLPAGAHKLRLQEQVLPRIVPFFGDLRYRSEPNLVPGQYSDWMVLPKFNKAYCEDQIEGDYRGIELKLAEVKLQYEYRSGSGSSGSSRTSLENAFKGLIVDLGLGRELPGVTLIRSQGSDMNGRFRLDEALVEVGTGSGFEVFSTHDAPGASLADAEFLDRLAAVAARFEARQLFASFHADRLVMLIDHKANYFEMSHRQETDFARDAELVRDQLGRFFAIVDTLQLSGRSPEEHTGGTRVPEFSEISGPNAPDPYDVGAGDVSIDSPYSLSPCRRTYGCWIPSCRRAHSCGGRRSAVR